MKNIFRFLMAAVMFFGAVSCAKEDISTSLAGGEVEVTLSVDVPELGTRAFGDGMTVDQLFIAVYEKDGTVALPISHIDGTGFQGSEAFSGGRATVTMVLLKDKTYDLVFWAQKSGTGAYDVNLANGRNIEANYGALCNLEDRDAFFFIRNNWKAGAQDAETEFHLNRPFAQINVANSDADVAFVTANGATIKYSKMTVKTTDICNTLNLLNGNIENAINAETIFAANAIPTEAFHIAGYNYLAMNYLLVNEKDLVNLKFEFIDDKNVTYTREYSNVPVQRNYRTNILGQIISSPIDFTVVIDPIFDGAHEVTPWDGKDTKEVTPNADGVYEISEASELAWLAAAVNGTRAEGDTFAGKTFVLTQDIDLCGHNWTPIGFNGSFNGIFDGNGKTISNLVVLGYNSTVGLFGTTQNGEIKNVTIKDAKVSGRLNVGVVAGNPYTSKYTNITVKGHIEVNGMAYVGGVGGKNAYANWTNVTVDVDEDSYVRANSVENGTAYRTYVGGVVGFNGEGTHSFTNIKSNVKVEGSTCDVGGLFGIAHYGNQFENCVCEGDVEIFAAEEAEEAEEIGGIAGVWNNNGQDVVMNNVEFNGNIITNVEATIWYGGLVGKPYSTSGKGKLVLNGETHIIVDSYEKLENAVAIEGINVAVKAGTYSKDDSVGIAANWAKNVTVTCEDGVIFKGLSKLNINGSTLIGGEFINHKGNYAVDQTLNGTFKNCFFNDTEGIRWAYAGETVVFEECTFGNVTCVRGIHFDGGKNDVVFNKCTFYGFQAFGSDLTKVTFNNCKFPENTRPQNVVNMYNVYEFNNCEFNPLMFCDCAGNGVVAHFNNCVYTDGHDIKTLVRFDKDKSTCEVRFNGKLLDGCKLPYDFDSTTKCYSVATAEGLEALANTTIKGGEKIVLTADIDLEGVDFAGFNAFNPENGNTFDGQGHTIRNFKKANAGDDFGFIRNWVGTIKNVTIEGAEINGGGRIAVLAAKPYGNIENCHIKNCTITSSYWACGGLAGLYNSGSVSNCSADNVTVSCAGGTGILIGVVNETSGSRNFTNCHVINCNIINWGAYGATYGAGMIAGMFNTSTTTAFTGCTAMGCKLNGADENKFYGYATESNKITIE